MIITIALLLCTLAEVNFRSVESLSKTLPKLATVHGEDILLLSKYGLQLYNVESDITDCRLPAWFLHTVHELHAWLLHYFPCCYHFVARSKCKSSHRQTRTSTQHMYRPFKRCILPAREAHHHTVVCTRFD